MSQNIVRLRLTSCVSTIKLMAPEFAVVTFGISAILMLDWAFPMQRARVTPSANDCRNSSMPLLTCFEMPSRSKKLALVTSGEEVRTHKGLCSHFVRFSSSPIFGPFFPPPPHMHPFSFGQMSHLPV